MSMRDVQYQPRAHRALQRAMAHQRMPHAYLFAGPEGVGKEMMATGLAQAMLCSQPARLPPARFLTSGEMAGGSDGESLSEFVDTCGECQDCLLVQAGTHPDLQIIYRQLNRQHSDSTIRKQKALVLGVEVIRQFLIERAGTCPSRGRAKVFIVREAERMNDAAQNCLLKTLEEPPRSTFLILLTSALDRMLPTTRSRCQQVMFSTLPCSFIISKLNEFRPEISALEVEYASRRAGGSLGAALRQLDDGLFALKQPWGQRLIELTRGGRGFAPHALAKPFDADAKTLAKLVSDRDPDVSDTDALRAGLQTLIGALGDFYSDALRQATGADLAPVNSDQPEVISELARLSPAALAGAVRSLSEADANLARNANIELTLESLFIGLARVQRQTILV